MDTAVSGPPPQSQASDRPPAARGHRRGRGGRRGNNNSSLNLRPSTVAPQAQPSVSRPANESDPSTNGTRGQSANRRGRGRAFRAGQPRTVNGRQFGGQLTRSETNETSQSSGVPQLQGDAPVFVPGQQQGSSTSAAQPKRTPSGPQQRKKRPSKSQAADIATRTHEDIDNGHYECPICTSEVRRNSKVWSCHTCWTVFHLGCVKKWSANEGSAAAQQRDENDEVHGPRQWRCPGCNLPQDEVPKTYSCWCGKEVDPRPLAGLPPHSCGNTCAKERVRKCPHPCELTCHAGPCPPCTHMGPTQVCFCGKHEVTKRCFETDYDAGWNCGEICGEIMPCGEHTCDRPCHEGFCGVCEVRVPARCYCGQVEKEVKCDDRGEEIESHRAHPTEGSEPVEESWTGSFDCGNVCRRQFDCGEHTCEKTCHVQTMDPGHCPRSPEVVTHCPCGKTLLSELNERPRQLCTDPIPQCKQRCGKILRCGHEDEQVCHTGNCMLCTKMVDIKCRCGRTTSRSICHQGHLEPPQCARTCKVLLNCGRHNCDERCCPGEHKAAERQSSKRKQRPLGSAPRTLDDEFEAEHICTHQCGRPLKCGNHYCEELCHRGSCGSCREAIFEEISCHCGKTVLQPPLPCGTQAPPCRFPCTRPKTCGHPQVAHNCHQDAEACPKCPFLIEKRCLCGKKTLKNQQCWLQDVRCGEVCGKKLKCGSHFCRKPCHRPGQCEDASGQSCQQPCGKPKKVCGHPDMENTCHAPFPCKEDKPCQSKIYITCQCQAQKQETKCGASKTNEGNGGKSLTCNDECARLERNRKLALALNIDQSTHVEGGDHIPYSTETLNLFAENPKWAQEQEREFRVFASAPEEKRLRFKPMQSHQRAFIHALAEDFGMDSESMDPEPHRHVMIWKTPRFVAAPNKTIEDALRVRHRQRSALAGVSLSDNESTRKAKPVATATAPYNGFVIAHPRFGLTIDELRAEIDSIVHPSTPLTFDIEFLRNGEVVLKAMTRTLSEKELQDQLQNLKASVISAISAKGYGAPELCATDSSLNIVNRESDSSAKDGWSQVAAKKAASRTTVSSSKSTERNMYSALNSKVTFAKKKPEVIKPKKEVVVDDWESAEEAEEEKEKAASAAASAAASEDEDAGIPGKDAVDPDSTALSETASIDRTTGHEDSNLVDQSVTTSVEDDPTQAVPAQVT